MGRQVIAPPDALGYQRRMIKRSKLRRSKLLLAKQTLAVASCVAAATLATLPARADIDKVVCGTRTGTAGNAELSLGGRSVIELATQGGDQSLLEAADALLPAQKAGEDDGTQNGSKYCLTVRYDAHGKPIKIVSARRQK